MDYCLRLKEVAGALILTLFLAGSALPSQAATMDISSTKPAHTSLKPLYIGSISWPDHEKVSWHAGSDCQKQGEQNLHISSFPDLLLRTSSSSQATAIAKAAKAMQYNVVEEGPSKSPEYIFRRRAGAVINIEVVQFSLKACKRGAMNGAISLLDIIQNQNELTGQISIKFSLFNDDPITPTLEHTTTTLLHEFHWQKSIGMFRQEILAQEAVRFIISPEVVSSIELAPSIPYTSEAEWIAPTSPPLNKGITNWFNVRIVNPFLQQPTKHGQFGELLYGPECNEKQELSPELLWEKRRALMIEDWPARHAIESWASKHGYLIASNGHQSQQAVSIEGKVSNLLFSACNPGVSGTSHFGEESSQQKHGYALSRTQITIDWTISDPTTPGQTFSTRTTGTSIATSPAENSVDAYRMALDHATHLLMAEQRIWTALGNRPDQPGHHSPPEFPERPNHSYTKKNQKITQWPWHIDDFNINALAEHRRNESGYLYRGATCDRYAKYHPSSVLLPPIHAFGLKERFSVTLANREYRLLGGPSATMGAYEQLPYRIYVSLSEIRIDSCDRRDEASEADHRPEEFRIWLRLDWSVLNDQMDVILKAQSIGVSGDFSEHETGSEAFMAAADDALAALLSDTDTMDSIQRAMAVSTIDYLTSLSAWTIGY